MEFLTFIKLFLLLTTIENVVLSARKKIHKSTSYNCICGEIGNKIVNRIFGGKITKPHAYPWHALVLVAASDGTFFCGGTVINDFYILTAGHCAKGFTINKFTIHLGVHDRKNFDPKIHQSYEVKKNLVHENYHELNVYGGIAINDIALLKLTRRITFTDYVKSICLPDKNEKIEGKIVTVIGLGSTRSDGEGVSTFLRETQVKVLKRKVCLENLKEFNYTMICTSGNKHACCGGDSGGSLFYLNKHGMAVQIGIVSFGKGDGCGLNPSYYASVLTFIHWIEKHTKEARYCYNPL